MDKDKEAAEQAAFMAELDDMPGDPGGDQAGEQTQETPPEPVAAAPEEPAAPPAQAPAQEPAKGEGEPAQEPPAAVPAAPAATQAEPEPAPVAQVDELEALRKQNAQLIAMVNTLAGGKAPAPVSTPPAPSQAAGAQPVQAPAQPPAQAPAQAPEELTYQPQQFFTAEELESLALDPAMNDGLNRVGTYIWDLVNKANQRLMAQAGQQAEAVVQYNTFMQDFYTANPDLREVRNVVTSSLETMAAEHAASGQVLDHDGALVALSQRVRTSLGLPATAAPANPAPAPAASAPAQATAPAPALPGYSGGRGGRGGGGKSGDKTQKDYMDELD